MMKVYNSGIALEAGVGFALSEDDYEYSRAQMTTLRGENIKGIVSVNALFYIETADFSTGVNFHLGTINEALMWPTAYQAFPGVEIITASLFSDTLGTAFAGTQVLDKVSIIINKSGQIYAYVNSITTPATLSAVDHIIIPVCVSFTKILDVVVNNT
jgi:hypothetical protein